VAHELSGTGSARQRGVKLQHPLQLYIGGEWLDARRGGRIEVVSPHNESIAAVVAEATEDDVNAAVAAARAAFDHGPWPRMSPQQRATYLMKLSAALEPRMPEVALAWTQQVGALAVAAPFVTGGAWQSIAWFASLAKTFPFVETRQPVDGRGAAYIVREPVGVVATIAPWNNPFGILLGKVLPALLTGCTVIMKPAPETPLDAHIIAEAAEAAGFPPGVINLIPAHREASDFLVRHAGVDKVAFTGSTVAGRRIASVCGERMARCTLELGGKSAAIVLSDADLPNAAKTLAATIAISAGQVCCTLSRVVVARSRHDELVGLLREEMRAIKVGDPFDATVQMGPLAMARQRERVEGYLALGRSEGACVVTGGGRPAHLAKGYYVEPTLFTQVTSQMRIAQEEIFGPVLTVQSFTTDDEAVQIANDSPYGLFGTVFTTDNERAWRIARGVRAGTISQNAWRLDPLLPFGGFKMSGIGREGGTEGIAAYTELKSVLLDGKPPAVG
jgi:aldehyde dehydrogenase (NAD+)